MPKGASFVTTNAVARWLRELHAEITRIPGLEDIFERPEDIWNVDETAMHMDELKAIKVFCRTGCQAPPHRQAWRRFVYHHADLRECGRGDGATDGSRERQAPRRAEATTQST